MLLLEDVGTMYMYTCMCRHLHISEVLQGGRVNQVCGRQQLYGESIQ